MTQQKTVLNWVTVIGIVVMLFGSFTWMAPVNVDYPTADEIAKAIEEGKLVYDGEGNVVIATEVDGDKLNALHNKYFEDDVWEVESEILASDEFEDNDYKDLFRWMDGDGNLSIEDRDDIKKVVVLDTEFSNMDSSDKEGTVTHELKVYYEDVTGDDLKEYITVTTTLDDGEVEDQEFAFS